MMEKDNNLQNEKRRTTLHATLRFLIAIVLQSGTFYYFTHGGAVGANDYDGRTGLNEFLLACIPTFTVLLLLPVIIRGLFSQRLIAIILSACPVWMGFYGWAAVIGRLFG